MPKAMVHYPSKLCVCLWSSTILLIFLLQLSGIWIPWSEYGETEWGLRLLAILPSACAFVLYFRNLRREQKEEISESKAT